MAEDGADLRWQWSAMYQPGWDEQPAAYVQAGLVGWGRSRRLARAEDAARGFKAYIGVHHFDPGQWGRPDPDQAKFFLSVFSNGRTVAFRTFATVPAALAELRALYARLG